MRPPKTPPKQIIVMRNDLGMRKGKMIAQGAHASMKVLLDRRHLPWAARFLLRILQPVFWVFGARGDLLTLVVDGAMRAWINGLFTKVCVQVSSEEELLGIFEAAKKAQLPCALIEDAGLTEFRGVRTKTCCAIGPAFPDLLDPVTKHLKLF